MDGLHCLIVGGRGIGQLRTITQSGPDEIHLDRPWTVKPDASSVVDVLDLPHDVITYANDFHDSSVAVQLYGATYNFIVDGNTSLRGGGFWGYATYYMPGKRYQPRIWNHFAPMYYAQFINNKILDGYVYEQGPSTGSVNIGGMIGLAANPWLPEGMSVSLGFGTVIKDNVMWNNSPVVLRTGFQEPAEPREPAIRYALIEGNQFDSVNDAIQIGPGTDQIVIRNNEFKDVVRHVVDHGAGTHDFGSAKPSTKSSKGGKNDGR